METLEQDSYYINILECKFVTVTFVPFAIELLYKYTRM